MYLLAKLCVILVADFGVNFDNPKEVFFAWSGCCISMSCTLSIGPTTIGLVMLPIICETAGRAADL